MRCMTCAVPDSWVYYTRLCIRGLLTTGDLVCMERQKTPSNPFYAVCQRALVLQFYSFWVTLFVYIRNTYGRLG